MIQYSDILSLQYLTTQVFTGSYKGMRYRICSVSDSDDVKVKNTDNSHLVAAVWPEPLSFASYGPERTVKKEFEFSEEGRVALIDWLNETFAPEA